MPVPDALLERRRASILEAATEVVTALLPIVVVLMVMMYVGKPAKLFQKPEWAFGAAIFFGQSLVKLLSAMSEEHRRIRAGSIVLFSTCIIVFGLAPSLLVLVFVIHSAEVGGVVAIAYQVIQVALFVVSAAAYVIVGAVSREMTSSARRNGH
jgi:hypothetical protein